MITEFGKILRKIRIDSNEILKDMADALGVSAAYLSAVEMGKRNIPEYWIEKICELYNLDEIIRKSLEDSIFSSAKTLTLNIENIQKEKKDTAILFARKFDDIDDDTLNKIRNLIKKVEE